MFSTFRKLLASLALLMLGAGIAQAQEVTIGYQLVYNPWIVAIANGDFEKATGYTINWRRFDSGAKVITAMASGDLHLALAGSSPIAAGVSRGLDVELIWVVEDIASAEALVVRDGSGINAPQDLKGKTLGVPFASTTHFHTLFALEQFGIDPGDLRVQNMQPQEISDRWESGDIDAAFIWDPALGRIKKTGKVLITSGLLSSWGKATFDGMLANRTWASKNPDFMCKFIKTIAATDESYRSNPAAWSPDSAEVKAIVGLIGGNPEDVPMVLDLYDFPSLEEQVSARWLGGGPGGGAARALTFTSEFLKAEKKIPTVLDDYSTAINPKWAEAALAGGC